METKSSFNNAFRIDLKTAARVALMILLTVGGFQGLYILSDFSSSAMADFFGTILALVLFAFYAGCLFAAYLLWKRKERGLQIALLLMFLQIPRIDTPTLGYRLASGFGSWFRQSAEGWTLVNNWTSCFNFNFVTGFGPNFGKGPSYYGINLFAVALAIAIFIAIRTRSQARPQENVSQVQPS